MLPLATSYSGFSGLVESLSAYARQFLGRMSKPECDYIKGIPPAIAIEQKVNTRNPRSTVGTSTEIYEYLRLLYARIGKTISPVSGKEVKKHQVSDIVKEVLGYPAGTRFAVYAPVVLPDGRSIKEQLEILQKEGYTRLSINETVYRIGEVLADDALLSYPVIELLIDRLVVSDDKTLKSRLADSAETAFFEGHDTCIIRIYTSEGTVVKEYSKKFEADGMVFEEPTDMMFSFNNPLGACPTCEGFGKVLGIDENLVVPDRSALQQLASAVILCHNHPSNNLNPSQADDKVTEKIKSAAALFDISVLDHIIVGEDGYFSYVDEGRL